MRQFGIVAAGLLFAFFGLCNHLPAKMQKAEVAFLSADGSHSSTAVSGQTVVFESDSAGNWVHVSLSEGQHQLCLETSGAYFSGIVLNDSPDQQELDAHGCLTVTGRRRFQQVRLSHGPDKPTQREIALLSIDPPGVPLVSSNGEMRKGYWAVTQWIQTGRTEPIAGRLRAIPSPEGRMPIVADRMSNQIDSYSLWQFGVHSGVMLAEAKSAFSFDPNGFPDSVKGTVFVTHGGEGPLLRAIGDSNRFQLRIAEDNDISPGAELGFAPTLFAPQTLKVLRAPSSGRPAIFSLLFRFFPDAIDVDSLAEGEAVLYQSADYQGRATVFPASAPDLAALSSDATTLDRGAVSIRVGPGTEATLYTGANYSGIATHIYNDVPVFAGAGNIASIRLTSLVAPLLASRSCVDCNFEGVDLSGLDLAGTDLTGARLMGANLTNTRLNGAQLTRADLSGATLSCTDLSGANANQLNDLTRTTFSNVKIVPRNSCQTNFSYTRLLVDALPPRSLAVLKLTGVHYERPPQAQAPVPGPPLVNTNGNPVGGYWAIQPDPAADPQKRAGRLRAVPPFQYSGPFTPNDAWVFADYTSQKMDEYSLFAFPPNPNSNGSILESNTTLNAYPLGDKPEDGPNFLTVEQGRACFIECGWVNQHLAVTDLGNYHFQLALNSGSFYLWNGPNFPTNALRTDGKPGSSAITLRVMFRFFPDGTQIGPLADGEAAIFQQPGFKGQAAIFAADPNGYNLDLLEGGATNLPGTTQSLRLGNNTAISWTNCLAPGCNQFWTGGLVRDEDNVGPANDHILYVQKLDQAIADYAQNGIDSPSWNPFLGQSVPACTGCRLANGNISGVSLHGWNLSGAIFSGATLSNVKLDSTTQLAGAKFNNATFSTVQFGNVNLQSVDLS
ncbi:MAG TPA: pentapeptide repeat-containing protein, partial [Bryobacteraceae bacterium]